MTTVMTPGLPRSYRSTFVGNPKDEPAFSPAAADLRMSLSHTGSGSRAGSAAMLHRIAVPPGFDLSTLGAMHRS